MREEDKCSFCGMPRKRVKLLITGMSGCICDNCARQAIEIIDQTEQQEAKSLVSGSKLNSFKPKAIKEYLSVCNRTRRSQEISVCSCI
jgi:ATP-dependent Clp protease ATP-binding subunit ClpX